MKKQLLALIATCLMATACINAQKIEDGSRWWDGYTLWTASYEGNTIVMNGQLPNNDIDFFQIYKLSGAGEYGFTSDRPYFNRFNADLGCTIKYIRKDGMYFLAVRNKKGETVWLYLLTPDNIENCMAQQKAMEEALPGNLLCNTLLNVAYLDRFNKQELRIMRNEIMARHGYNFQSKDLKDYFSQKSWYKPAKDNNSIKLNIIEETNIQLMKYLESVK